jgi:hypothetical protein
MWSDLKYAIADRLFCVEMDDAFRMGVQHGAEFATRNISFQMNLKNKDLTKAQQVGYDKALSALRGAKEIIQDITGAQVR